MARIPDEEIEPLKRQIRIERLVSCPFHDDHEPSLVLTPALDHQDARRQFPPFRRVAENRSSALSAQVEKIVRRGAQRKAND